MHPSTTTNASPLRTLAGAIAVATLVGCGLSLTVALLSVRLDQAGFSARAIGVNTAAGGIATLVCAPFIPWAARTIGLARLLFVSLLAGGTALVGFTWTSDYLVWLLLRFGEGLAVTVMFVVSEFWIASAAPPKWRGLTIAIYVTCLALGFASGPLILTNVGTAGNMPFYLGAGLFFGAAVPLLLNTGGAPALADSSGKTMLSFVFEAPAATLAAMLHGAIEVAGLGLLPIYALRSGLTIADGAFFASLFVLGNCLLQLTIGWFADRYDRRRVLFALAMLGCFGATILAMYGTVDRVAFDLLLVLWGGIVGALYPIGLGHLGSIYQGSDLVRANAVYVMMYALGMLIGPPLVGVGLDLLPPSGFFWTIALLILCYLAQFRILTPATIPLAAAQRGLSAPGS